MICWPQEYLFLRIFLSLYFYLFEGQQNSQNTQPIQKTHNHLLHPKQQVA